MRLYKIVSTFSGEYPHTVVLQEEDSYDYDSATDIFPIFDFDVAGNVKSVVLGKYVLAEDARAAFDAAWEVWTE